MTKILLFTIPTKQLTMLYKGGNEYQRKANTGYTLTIHAIILPSVNPVKRQISLPLNISPFPLLQLNMFQLSSTAVTTPMY